jgi:hypothetical protein
VSIAPDLLLHEGERATIRRVFSTGHSSMK